MNFNLAKSDVLHQCPGEMDIMGTVGGLANKGKDRGDYRILKDNGAEMKFK